MHQPRHRLFLLILAVASLCRGGTTAAVEFVGDLTMASAQQMLHGRIHVKDSVYRMDIAQGAMQFFVTVNEHANEVRVFNPQAKTYRVVPTKSPECLQNDPFQALRYGDSMGVREYRGIDTVSGWVCDQYVIRLEKQPVMVEWRAQELDFPIRIRNLMTQDSAFVELTNIEVGPVDSAVFAIPEGYTHKEEPAGGADRAPGGAKAGEIVRRPLDPTQPVELALVNLSQSGSKCEVDLLRGGKLIDDKEIGPLASRTFSFGSLGEQTRRIFDNAADQIVVRIISGEIAVNLLQPE